MKDEKLPKGAEKIVAHESGKNIKKKRKHAHMFGKASIPGHLDGQSN